tara:strand:+ start:2553 stop:2867 length:315 start_codon:yes stop_codon:yes gene_type:complete
MWVIMNKAYFSIVENKNNQEELLVRARVAGDIERVFPDAEVLKNTGADYLYRASISKSVVSNTLKNEIENIDYGNFKNTVPWEDELRHDVYFNVWNELSKLQQY